MEIEIKLLVVALLLLMIPEVRSGFSRNEGGRNLPAESIADTLNSNQRHRSSILEWIGDIMQDKQTNRKAHKQLIGDNMNDIQGTIIPILSDMLCKACLKLEEEKRLNCTKKHCTVTQKQESFPTSDAAIFPNIVIGDTRIANSDKSRGEPSFVSSKTSHSSIAIGSSSFTTGSSSFTSSSSNSAGRPASSSEGKALSGKSSLSQQVHKFVNNGISNKLKPEDRSRVVIAKLIDILCKLCENMNNEKERQECIDKFKCVKDGNGFAGLHPKKFSIRKKILKSEAKQKVTKGKSRNRNSKPETTI